MTKIREMDGQDKRDGWPRLERWVVKIREMDGQDQRNGWSISERGMAKIRDELVRL